MDRYIKEVQLKHGTALYAHIPYRVEGQKKRKFLTMPTGAWKGQDRLAYTRIGKFLDMLENGIHPKAHKMFVSQLNYEPDNEDNKIIWTKGVKPFFEDTRIMEMDKTALERYAASRWGMADGKRPHFKKDTFSKHVRVLKYAIRTVLKTWEPPGVDCVEIPFEKKPPLTFEDARIVAPYVKAQSKKLGLLYWVGFWIEAYTAIDTGDVIALASEHFIKDRTWIKKLRGKTGQWIKMPIPKPLLEIIDEIPWPLDKKQPLFQGISAGAMNKAITRAFIDAAKVKGNEHLAGYGSKYLRRMVSSLLMDYGFDRYWIGKALSHAEGSRQTDKYPDVYDETFEKRFAQVFGR